MELIRRDKVLTMVRRSLNLVDPRLVDHGIRVAMILQDMLRADGCADAQLRKELVILALFHDIGAYRTEEISRLIRFETKNVWEHAVYSYLFLRKYFPRDDRARIVLYHHADYDADWREDGAVLRYGQMLHVADRACIWHDEVKAPRERLEAHLTARRGSTFSPHAVDAFLAAARQYGTWEKLDLPPALELLTDCTRLSQEEAETYLYILVDAIDFRSRVTVTHTRGLMEISLEMARLAGLPEEKQQKIYYGALMHDLGKIGTPLSILEKPGRLTPDEFEIMKRHVVLSAEIIRGCVDEETARIALRHHEKLDGSGYPLGLTAEELTLPQRLLAVGDVVSALCMSRSYKDAFPKERCLSILRDMSERGQLDADMVALIGAHFDAVLAAADRRCAPLYEGYSRMRKEFRSLAVRFAAS